MKRVKAFLRKDLLEDGITPNLIGLDPDKINWEQAKFTCWQPDELDHCEFNLVMVSEKHGIFQGCSIDFDFV